MLQSKSSYARSVYIVDGLRTPWLKAHGKSGAFSASDLAVQTCRPLLTQLAFTPNQLDEIVAACVMPSVHEANIARIMGLRLACGQQVTAYTVQRNCASGMQALDSAASNIAAGRSNLVLAGGTEAMSHAPLLFRNRMVKWLSAWHTTKNNLKLIKLLKQFRLNYLTPINALIAGLTDPVIGLSMGQTSEIIASQFNVTREAMDAWSLASHQRLAAAQDNKNFFDEITTLYDTAGCYYDKDNGLRRDTTLEKLAALKPIFDKPFGQITAGNSSQVTDGAAFLILASAEAVKRYNLPVLARIIDTAWAGVDPVQMGLGPVHAVAALLSRHQLNFDAIDYWEINEAFSAQVLACLAAWKSDTYCREHLGHNHAWGEIDPSRLNIDGGSVAMGHPLSASGARIVLHLAKTLKRHQAQRGIATLCIGGGQGGAMLIENVSEVT